ncbi:MAG: hypothetical protein BWY61_01798 [Firmicutes bacterium ADurb.Bin354]|nr:MAG: hypothetical protein BWY61_01798 [Firmicutes bacterium ADurb.Bin354]
MLDADNGCKTVSDIGTCKIGIFILKYTQLSCIAVDNGSEHCLKTGYMSTAVRIIDIITESKYILLEFIYILESDLDLNALSLSLIINNFRNGFFSVSQSLNKTDDTFGLVIFHNLRFITAKIRKSDGKTRVEIRCLMKSAFDILSFEYRLIKNGIVRDEINLCSCLSGIADLRKKSACQLGNRLTLFIFIFIYMSVSFDGYGHMIGKSIYNGRTYTVKSTAGLICFIIELTAGMKCGKYNSLCRHAFCVHLHRHTTTVIFNGCRSVFLQSNMNMITASRKMFINRVINYLIYKMVETFGAGRTDIHSRSLTDRFKSLQNHNIFRTIRRCCSIFIRHYKILPVMSTSAASAIITSDTKLIQDTASLCDNTLNIESQFAL